MRLSKGDSLTLRNPYDWWGAVKWYENTPCGRAPPRMNQITCKQTRIDESTLEAQILLIMSLFHIWLCSEKSVKQILIPTRASMTIQMATPESKLNEKKMILTLAQHVSMASLLKKWSNYNWLNILLAKQAQRLGGTTLAIIHQSYSKLYWIDKPTHRTTPT